jgi:acetoin utilization protein AcuB
MREFVHEWMTPDPITVDPDATVSTAYALMRKHHIRRLPVVEGDWLVGIVTLGDLWAFIAALEADPHIFRLAFHLDRITVMQIMTHEAVTVAPDTPIRVACELLLRHEVGALPVVVEGRLVGILTESDIFRLVAQRWSMNGGRLGNQGERHNGCLYPGRPAHPETSVAIATDKQPRSSQR